MWKGRWSWKSTPDYRKIQRIWIGFPGVLNRNQLEGALGCPFRPGAIFCQFLIWIKRPTSDPQLYNRDVGRGWLPFFLSFSARGGEGLGLSNSRVSGKSYIEVRYNPQKPCLRQRTQTSEWQTIIFGDLNRKRLRLKKSIRFKEVYEIQIVLPTSHSFVQESPLACSLKPSSPSNFHTNGV